MTKLLATTALASLMATSAFATELTVGAANVSSYLDPGRDHSNVGSQFYYNAFDTLIAKNHDTTDTEWQPGLATEGRPNTCCTHTSLSSSAEAHAPNVAR